ncbi:hydantoinase B/oxoprolinase family protein [Streptomyces sp. NPDC087437]|uniref:hydantoinase B/oxoprolinase family protein n=1 Tax=Streptomyces sp. NPDC087437 TaxID=3365789 RepID=UPI0038264EF6
MSYGRWSRSWRGPAPGLVCDSPALLITGNDTRRGIRVRRTPGLFTLLRSLAQECAHDQVFSRFDGRARPSERWRTSPQGRRFLSSRGRRAASTKRVVRSGRGMDFASWSPKATAVWQEGLRIPAVKLVDGGELREDGERRRTDQRPVSLDRRRGGQRAEDPALLPLPAPRPGTGGAGRRRGGLGAEVGVTVAAPKAEALVMTHGVEVPNSVGLGDDLPGAMISRRFRAGEGQPRDLGPKPGSFPITPADLFEVTWQGGGGIGDPLDRDPADVLNDICYGLVTQEEAQETYGVALSGYSGSVDAAATSAARRDRQFPTTRYGWATGSSSSGTRSPDSSRCAPPRASYSPPAPPDGAVGEEHRARVLPLGASGHRHRQVPPSRDGSLVPPGAHGR